MIILVRTNFSYITPYNSLLEKGFLEHSNWKVLLLSTSSGADCNYNIPSETIKCPSIY